MTRAPRPSTVGVYLEVGPKRTFAGAIDWPGWDRVGKGEEAALEALEAYRGRYSAAMGRSLAVPARVTLRVVERLPGNATTDFGAPDAAVEADLRSVKPADLERLTAILGRAWRTFDEAVEAAEGMELAKGPRGGGRSLDAIAAHVLEAESGGYLNRLGGKAPAVADLLADRDELRKAVIETLAAAVRGEIEETGPRGGKRWKPRRFVRRAAWHALDHAWEIEDRSS